ncbi:MAG TPA: ABC transporter substrate-binding protein, partial [Anaerolineae bacterium]|nr:ABC transporter substrate-binding protein [Anaerolineae bacterium]
IEQSEDGLTIDFKLKEGVQFQGGYGELTAEDVKFSYERIADPATDSPYRGDWAALDHVEVTGKYTGQIILKEPFAPLWNSTLPLGSGWVLSKKAVEDMGLEAFATHPIGTGPYEFVEWTPNEKIVLKRFADYWGEPLEWDEIHFIPVVEDSAAEIALETGELDFGRIAPGSVERFEADDRFEVIQVPTIDYTWLAMNVQHPNLEDINVREAIRHAVDVPSVLEAAYDGKWTQACALIAPGQVGHWTDAPCYERDVDMAKEFLAQAGVDTLDLTLTTDEAEESKAAAEVIQANLADIGINVEIIQQDAAAYYEGGFGEKGLTERQLTYVGFVNQPDPSWATVWFTCEQVDEWNWMYWCNEEYDKLHEAALKETDQEKRAEMYIQMQQLWDEAAHTVWIGYDTLYYVVRSDLEAGILPHGRYAAWSIHSK